MTRLCCHIQHRTTQRRLAHNGRRRAFTLVEMMLALVLTGILTAVVGNVAVQSFRMTEAARAQSGKQFAWTSLRDAFESDVRGTLTDVGDRPSLVVREGDATLLRVVSLARVVDATATFRQYLPAWVTYEVEDDPAQPLHKRIIRSVRSLTEQGAEPARRIMASGLVDVRIEHFDKKAWSDGKFESNQKTPMPKAIRLVCMFNDETIGRRSRTIVLEGPDD